MNGRIQPKAVLLPRAGSSPAWAGTRIPLLCGIFSSLSIQHPVFPAPTVPVRAWKTRALNETELMRRTKPELAALLRRIAAELPKFPEGSVEPRNAHSNLHITRRALARPGIGPRP